jgi:polyisoprenoid-binding protein YceI
MCVRTHCRACIRSIPAAQIEQADRTEGLAMTATRTIDDIQAPAAGVWTIDPTHTTVEFIARHLVFTKVRGRFTGVSGAVTVADDPDASSVEITLDATSITTGTPDRDAHLKNEDFFDVEKYPVITFKSTSVEWKGQGGVVTGDLTVHGVTKPITLEAELTGVVTDPWGGDRAVFSASGEVDREAWGLVWNMALESGGVVVSKKIKLEIETEIVLQKPQDQ